MRILPGFKLKGPQFITSSGRAKPGSPGNCPLDTHIAILHRASESQINPFQLEEL